MTEKITLAGGQLAERNENATSGPTYSTELANPSTGRITVLRVQLPRADDPQREVEISAAWRGLEPRPLDALAPRWLVEAVDSLLPQIHAAEQPRTITAVPAG